MVEDQLRSDTPLFDKWIAEVGEESVRAVIDDVEGRIANGSLRGFANREEFFLYMRRDHRYWA